MLASKSRELVYTEPMNEAPANDEALPLSDWQKKLLDERLEEAMANPDSWIPWEEVTARILASLKKPFEA